MTVNGHADRAATASLSAPEAGRPQWIWRSGRLEPWEQATIHVNAVGHASVAAIFEGIKAYRSADGSRLLVFRLDDHLRRLLDSARICRLRLPFTVADLRSAAIGLLQANSYADDTYLRPWAFPQGVIMEAMVPQDADCEVIVDSWPFRSNLREPRGCRAAVSSWRRISESAMPPRAKAFANYHNGRLAMMEARTNGHDWPIMLNDRGKVCEGPGACVALVRDGVVITPALTSGLLDSITRASALTLLREAGLAVEEREVDRSELYLADELFFLGTAWEILPVTTIDGLLVGDGAMGAVVRRLEQDYSDVVRGVSGRHGDWLTEVGIRARERAGNA